MSSRCSGTVRDRLAPGPLAGVARRGARARCPELEPVVFPEFKPDAMVFSRWEGSANETPPPTH